MSPSPLRTRVLSRLAPVPLLVAVVLGLAGCSGGLGGDSDAGTAAEVPMAGTADGAFADEAAAESGREDEAQERALIRQGQVTLVADDVAAAKDEVERVVDEYLGEVADERTETDDDGELSETRLVLRVPEDDFTEVLDEVSGIAELRSATSTSEDVTTQVIDTRVRIRAQEKSLRRVEQLLGQARSLRAIVAIEAQLTRRQAELDSLKSQRAYLADQTSMGTLTVRISRTVADATAAPADEKGFLAGLSGGWGALKSTAVALATVTGALLPFAVVAGVVAVPLLLLLRLRRSRRPVIPA